MKVRLFCKTGQLAGASFEIGREATIGKSPGNSVQLYPSLISGKHARIYFDEKERCYVIEDLGSRNGTRVDGVNVKGKERLSELNIITFSNTFDFLFQILDESTPAREKKQVKPAPAAETPEQKERIDNIVPPVPPRQNISDIKNSEQESRQKTMLDDGAFSLPSFEEKEQSPATDEKQRTKVSIDFTPVPSFVEPSKPPKSADQVASDFVLIFENVKGGPLAFDIKEGSSIIGREQSSAICIDDSSMSRKHAEIVLKGGRLTLKDLGSKNHTYIDNQRISKEVEVKEGMKITFGVVKTRLVRKPAK